MKTIKDIEQFQYITNQWAPIKIEEQIELVCSVGCKWVQLRLKNTSEKDWKSMAISAKSICNKYSASLSINDNVKLAKEINAHGVHLGQNDLAPAKARSILGENFIIGGTANNINDVIHLTSQKVNYIGLGPFRFTSTKQNLSPILGIEGYNKIVTSCKNNKINTPIIAIGGILPRDIQEILNTEIWGIAVSSVISNSKSPIDITKQIIKTINSNKNASIKNS